MDEKPCEICSEPIYLTVGGEWRHVETDYVHPAIADERTLDRYIADVEIKSSADVKLRRPGHPEPAVQEESNDQTTEQEQANG